MAVSPATGAAARAKQVSEVSIPREYYQGGLGPSIVPAERAAATPALLLQPYLFDRHNTIDRLAHVINGQRGNADGGQCFHFHAGAAEDADGRFNAEEIVAFVGEINGCRRDRQRMAKGDEVAGALGGHDAGQAGDFEDVAFG